jgi:hypothetical protein
VHWADTQQRIGSSCRDYESRYKTAFAAALNDNTGSVMKFKSKVSLIALCGMNCGICMAYLRDKNRCPGCRQFNAKEPVSIARCKIKNCEVIQKGKIKFCFGCDNFPCKNLKHLDKRYRTKYHMSMIDNLETIKNFGIRKFLKNENVRWTCSRCGGTICVHRGYCCECGRKK